MRTFSERIDADSASLSNGSWRLVNAVGAEIGQRAVRYATLDLPSSLADEEAFERFARPQATSFWSLPAQIDRIEAAGFSSTAYRLRLQQLLATPLMFAAMSILAAAFSLRLMRLGDLARMSVAAVVLGFAFFFVNQAASAFGSAEVIPPWLAAWLPPLLTALAAFTLLFYTEDG
jgi:lipopolysaccharide export system permease protein